MMIKISLKLLRATQDGVVIAQRAVRTYTRYAFYSFRDRKGKQTNDQKSRSVDGPRHSLMYNNVEDFVLSQWSDNARPYAIYRSIVALYFLLMVLYTAWLGTLGIKIFIMLTYWSYWILTGCQILRAVNCWHYISLLKQGKDPKVELQNKRRIKVQWLLHNLGSDAAPLVSAFFWTLAYDGSGITTINCTTHGLNALFVIVDTIITRTPIRMLHLYQGSCLGLVYGMFTAIYWAAGGTNHLNEPFIYKCIDYSKSIKEALSYIMVTAFIVAPIIHCWIFFLYRFRLFIHRYLRTVEKRNDQPCVTTEQEKQD